MLTDLHQDKVPEMLKEFVAEMLNIVPGVINLFGDFHASARIFGRDRVEGIVEDLPVNQAEGFDQVFIPDLLSRVGDHLVEKALSVPHAPLRCSRKGEKASRAELNSFRF